MKITRKQLRKIIREEAARPFPIENYPNEMLMQEGLWDAISNFLGSIIGFFTDAWGEAEGKVKGQIGGYRDKYQSGNWQSLAKKIDPKGKGDPPKAEDVDYSQEKYAPAFWGSWSVYAPKVLKGVQEKLAATDSITDWIPPEGTKPEEWMKGDGKSALGINRAFGEMIALIADAATGAPDLKGVADSMRKMNPEDAGKAAQGVADAAAAIVASSAIKRAEKSAGTDAWKALPHTGDVGQIQGALESIKSAAEAIVAKVEEDAKAQEDALQDAAEAGGGDETEAAVAEWVDLRKHINAMIITERRRR